MILISRNKFGLKITAIVISLQPDEVDEEGDPDVLFRQYDRRECTQPELYYQSATDLEYHDEQDYIHRQSPPPPTEQYPLYVAGESKLTKSDNSIGST